MCPLLLETFQSVEWLSSKLLFVGNYFLKVLIGALSGPVVNHNVFIRARNVATKRGLMAFHNECNQ
jgi:hypothetical protein